MCHNRSLGLTKRSQIRTRLLIGALLVLSLGAQTTDEEFRVYKEHPRLFLSAQKLRLLKRERERDSVRWQQFDTLAKGGAPMAEPGFAAALYYAVSGDNAQGRKAIEWAFNPAARDLRQLAIVYDWCQPVLSPEQSKSLAAKIRQLMGTVPARPENLPAWRDRVLAIIATADDTEHGEEKLLRQVVEEWWRRDLAPALLAGRASIAFADVYALAEIMHAIRDNLKVELQEAAPEYFRELPKFEILGTYPAPLDDAGNEYWIPVYKEAGQPDLQRAALARAAGLSLVSYDNNALENQYLQGWLMQDRFILRSTFGTPYEFLWANPYQPGLSYVQLPLLFHDARSGALFVRSSWEEDAVWFGMYEGEAQLFQDGKITVLNRAGRAAAHAKPIQLGAVAIVPGASPVQFPMETATALVVGLKAGRKYAVEIDDQEMSEVQADPAGTLVLENPAKRTDGVRIREVGE